MMALQKRAAADDVQTGDLLHALTGAEMAVERILRRVPEMSRDERLTTFSMANTGEKLNWMIKACIMATEIDESNYRDGAYLTLARVYGVSASHVHRLALVWNTFFAGQEIASPDAISLTEFSWYRGAAEAARGNRTRALALLAEAQDRKAANPTYSVTDFRLDLSAGMPPQERIKERHQLINASGNNEWYTPRPFLDAAHELMGGIDLDPASNERANLTVRAQRYYTINDDGTALPWFGRVWLNPPYGREEGESNQSLWTDRLIREYQSGSVSEALILVNAVTGNHWFRPLKQFPICFPDSRIRFYNEHGELGQPTHSNALVYLGPNVDGFERIFSRFGAVMAIRKVWHGR